MAVPAYRVILEGNVPAKMRDGTTLYADVWRPDAPGRFPVLITRTPYDKMNHFRQMAFGLNPIRAVNEGYVVIIQDTRGRFTSEGNFYPFMHEMSDGYDTVEWAAGLPYSNGEVGMYGASYGAITQWMATIQRPPHLKAIFPVWMGDGAYEGTLYSGGAFQLGLALYWAAVILAPGELLRRAAAGQNVISMIGALKRAIDSMPQAYDQLPLRGTHSFLGDLAPYYDDWLSHPDDGEYWERWRVSRHASQIYVPACSVGGWFDLYSGTVPKIFNAMPGHAGDEEARKGQKLIVGPWAHAVSDDAIGDLYFGVSATLAALDITALHLRWFDCWLKGQDNGIRNEPSIKLFIMGDNAWRNEHEWPLARTEWTNFYFHSASNANSVAGGGRLSPALPAADEQPDVFHYDPHNPVPTAGGASLMPGVSTAANAGPKEQSRIESREDVLVYTTNPLERDVEVTGPITVTLFAATSATDTDWTAKLVDVYPDGRAYNLADGIIRARYREGTDKGKLLEPGQSYEYRIDLQTTSNVFKSGHRIRVQVSSSNFPRFDRNPNTGRVVADNSELLPARQTVYHNSDQPSHITLPIIPRG